MTPEERKELAEHPEQSDLFAFEGDERYVADGDEAQ